MILLGALFTDKVPVDVYQLHRNPPGWKWQEGPSPEFILHRPKESVGQPVLTLSLSGRITHDRIHAAVGSDVRIWEVTVPEPHNRLLRTKAQLAAFSDLISKVLAEIGEVKNSASDLKIFPAMSVACAVELGRIRMPKADLSWEIYDQNNKIGGFMRALTID
jgi:hypothetical protein